MDITLPEGSTFEWDKYNTNHIAEHDVIPEEAESVFYQEPQIIAPDEEHSQKENRYSMLGRTASGRLLNIIFMFKGKHNEIIRVISARNQTKTERKIYEQELIKVL